MKRTWPLDNTEIIILMQAVSLERFYLTRETVNNNYMWHKIAKKKKKTIAIVHYSTWYSTTFFMG